MDGKYFSLHHQLSLHSLSLLLYKTVMLIHFQGIQIIEKKFVVNMMLEFIKTFKLFSGNNFCALLL